MENISQQKFKVTGSVSPMVKSFYKIGKYYNVSSLVRKESSFSIASFILIPGSSRKD